MVEGFTTVVEQNERRDGGKFHDSGCTETRKRWWKDSLQS